MIRMAHGMIELHWKGTEQRVAIRCTGIDRFKQIKGDGCQIVFKDGETMTCIESYEEIWDAFEQDYELSMAQVQS
jgi:competence transcription factor ComK